MQEFRCAMCFEMLLMDHLAFVIELEDMKEGVCGFCADGDDL